MMVATMRSTTAKTATGPAVQFAALPYRRETELRILLITSRETRRWVIPKGWPMDGLKPHAAAAQEALEEAGVRGAVSKKTIGFYRYHKRLPNGATRPCTVHVFPLEVSRQDKIWRERGQRDCRWFTLEEAAHAVDEPELQDLIHGFAVSLGYAPTCETGRQLAEAYAQAAAFTGMR